MGRLALLVAMFVAAPLCAQPNGVVLVAKPELADPNFRETVVLVTRSDEGSTVGVILNRPDTRSLTEIAPRFRGAQDFKQPLYAGGPVLREVIVALYKAKAPSAEAAFRVLPQLYLTMHPAIIERLLAAPPREMRIYAGFCGWAPQQLEAEIAAGSWYVLAVNEEMVLRRDTSGLWAELVAKASGARTTIDDATRVADAATSTVAPR
jgi:putative transcriptional regulator